MSATAIRTIPTVPEAEPAAEDALLEALAATAKRPLAPGDVLVVQALATALWRKGVRR